MEMNEYALCSLNVAHSFHCDRLLFSFQAFAFVLRIRPHRALLPLSLSRITNNEQEFGFRVIIVFRCGKIRMNVKGSGKGEVKNKFLYEYASTQIE